MFKIVGCHTDSPVLKLAPVSKTGDRAGFQQLGVQLYGGGLWHTWFDRDLTLAGKVIITGEDGKLHTRYWWCKDAILKVPNLAIHLTDRSGNFEPNKESHTKPILASSVVDQLFGSSESVAEDTYRCEDKHFKNLLKRIATDLKIETSQIVDFELNVIDTQPSAIVGLHKEFVSSPRVDNLVSSLVALDSLIECPAGKDDAEVNMIMLFDHEEVGSQSAQGADSNMAVEATTRIFESLSPKQGNKSDYYRAIRQSFLISADMAHAIHPNY
jgi:aspartyl aminopeptidase